MKIIIAKFLVLLFATSMIAPRLSIVSGDNPRTIHVRGDFSTIQEAINNANPGDTISVGSGTYYEHVVVNKTLSLIGEDNANTIIDGSNNGTVVEVTADNVTLTGFKLQNSGYGWTRHGVYVYKANNCQIKRNWFFNTCHNIRINYSRNSEVTQNMINGAPYGVTMYGIRLENSVNCVALDNTVSDCVGGVHLENATECLVKNNYLAHNDQAFRLYSPCTYIVIAANTMYNNSYDGMIAVMPPNATFSDNLIIHNNFINNSNSFIIQSNGTVWDDGHEGNYWSRYVGFDSDLDGVGDIAHNITGMYKDNHPLMGKFSSFNTTFGYKVDFISDSSISNFRFSQLNVSHASLTFNATGDPVTQGFCRICIPKALINGLYVVKLDGEIVTQPQAKELPCSNETYEYIYLNYTSNGHVIEISGTTPIPEFQSLPILQLSLVAAILASLAFSAFILRKKSLASRRHQEHPSTIVRFRL